MAHSLKLPTILIAAAVAISAMTVPSSKASVGQDVSTMQVFNFNGAPQSWTYYAVNQPSTVPTGLIEADGKVSVGFEREINRALDKMPVNVLKALHRTGYKILLSEKLTDAVPAARDQQVRGYQAHATWDTVYGMFNRTTKRVVMAEQAQQKDSAGHMALQPLRDQVRREGILRHECGHAVDQYLGNLSHTAEFKAAYEKGLKSISKYERATLSYYLQSGDAGKEETFAEIFAALNEYACDRNSDILLKNHFPELVSLIRAKVNTISG